MPVLKNPKHEAFAQARFRGQTATDAFVTAGYKANDSNAARLNGNERVRDRIAELQQLAANKAIQMIAFDAKALFARLENQIALALDAHEHKVAMDGRQFMIECFGYHSSPTLTQEHIAGRQIAPQPVPADSGETTVVEIFPPAPRFTALITRMKKRLEG